MVKDAPSPLRSEGECDECEELSGLSDNTKWRPSPHRWEKIKPLARQMRHEPTPAEDQLWAYLRNRQLMGVKFRRRHGIGKFVVDFYSAEAHLVVEVDGPIHEYTAEEDPIRQEFLENLGFKVFRFTNQEILNSPEHVIEQIRMSIAESRASKIPDSPSLRSGEGGGG
jgi:very-short-patch-repair endonuclease